jgi:uroporphyrinogen-III synthase
MPRLAVTRPADQLGALSLRAAKADVRVFPLPLLDYRPCAFDWPTSIRTDDRVWLLFTSAQGVSAGLDHLRQLHISLPATTQYAAIGHRTAEALHRHGLTASFLPSEPYGELFFTEFLERAIRPGEAVVYLRGREITTDPAALFAEHLVRYFPLICYEGRAADVDTGVIRSFTGDDYILFTAPSAVEMYHRRFGAPVARAIAIGRTTGSAMLKLGWPNRTVMAKPDLDSVMEYLT